MQNSVITINKYVAIKQSNMYRKCQKKIQKKNLQNPWYLSVNNTHSMSNGYNFHYAKLLNVYDYF